MDEKELIQEIEKNATQLLSGPGTGGTSKLQALMALHEIERDKERNELMVQVLERSMPDLMKAMTRSSEDGAVALRRDLMSQLYDANRVIKEMAECAMQNFIKGTGFDVGVIEKLADAGEYDGAVVPIDDVDWKAVHACEMRAPRYLKNSTHCKDWEVWEEGAWLHISEQMRQTFNEVHVTALGYLNASTAAVYRFCEDGTALLYWERRVLYTAQMTEEQLRRLKEKMR